MPSRKVRILTLLFMAWANIYCCCRPGAAAAAVELNTAKPDCCAVRHAAAHPAQHPSRHRLPDGRDCDECPYLAVRHSTVIDNVSVDVSPPTLCVLAASCDLQSPLSLFVEAAPARRIDPVQPPTALLDLRTSLVR